MEQFPTPDNAEDTKDLDTKKPEPFLRLVKNEGDAPLTKKRTVTPEQKRTYEEARVIFGGGAHRPDAPGQPISKGSMDNLGKAKFSNSMARHALRLAANLSPKYREKWLRQNGIDPNAPEIAKVTNKLRIVNNVEVNPTTETTEEDKVE